MLEYIYLNVTGANAHVTQKCFITAGKSSARPVELKNLDYILKSDWMRHNMLM